MSFLSGQSSYEELICDADLGKKSPTSELKNPHRKTVFDVNWIIINILIGFWSDFASDRIIQWGQFQMFYRSFIKVLSKFFKDRSFKTKDRWIFQYLKLRWRNGEFHNDQENLERWTFKLIWSLISGQVKLHQNVYWFYKEFVSYQTHNFLHSRYESRGEQEPLVQRPLHVHLLHL